MCTYVVHHVDVCFLSTKNTIFYYSPGARGTLPILANSAGKSKMSRYDFAMMACAKNLSLEFVNNLPWHVLHKFQTYRGFHFSLSRRLSDPVSSIFSRSLTTRDECHFRFRSRVVKYRKTLEGGDRQTSRRAVFLAVSMSTCDID